MQTCIWDAGEGKQKKTLVGKIWGVGSFLTNGRWGTDDVGNQHWRRSAEYTEAGGKEADRKKRERNTGKMLWRARHPEESWRGGKGRDQNHQDGKLRNLI